MISDAGGPLNFNCRHPAFLIVVHQGLSKGLKYYQFWSYLREKKEQLSASLRVKYIYLPKSEIIASVEALLIYAHDPVFNAIAKLRDKKLNFKENFISTVEARIN